MLRRRIEPSPLWRRAVAAGIDGALGVGIFGPWIAGAAGEPTDEDQAEAGRRAAASAEQSTGSTVMALWRPVRDSMDDPPADSGPHPLGYLLGWGLASVRPLSTALLGGSPGQRLLGLRVVTGDGRRVGLARALLRDVPFQILMELTPRLLPVRKSSGCLAGVAVWAVDLMWPLWQPQRRSLHDLLAGTHVVLDR